MFNFGKIHAPEFKNLSIQFVNTDKFSLADLKGNIILMDFWTYCCINCIRTVPDLRVVEETFKNDPVAVVGIHSAKFDNENNSANVLNAIGRYNIAHPIILDEKREVWDSYAVNAWPTLLLIDSEGYIRKGYSGEGHREEFLRDIKNLLEEGKKNKTLSPKFNFNFTYTPKPSTLFYPGKISILNDRIAIANSNRNNILIGTLTDSEIKIDTKIGSGEKGYKDGDYTAASFSSPESVILDDGIAYVADTENNLIRLIDLNNKLVSTLQTPLLRSPWDLALKDGKLYIALAGSHQIGVYEIGENKFSTFAGSGYENILDGAAHNAALAQTSGLSIFGNTLYFADSETSSIRDIVLKQPFHVNTIVGTGLFDFGMEDGDFQNALFQHPLGLTVSGDNIYVADTYNSAIRQIDLKAGKVTTLIASMGHDVCRIDDKDCDVLGLNEPSDVKIWKDSLIISDTNNHLIRRFDFKTKVLSILEIKE